jgi:hypothetical protein
LLLLLSSSDSSKAAYMLSKKLSLPWVLEASFGAFFHDLLECRLVVTAVG